MSKFITATLFAFLFSFAAFAQTGESTTVNGTAETTTTAAAVTTTTTATKKPVPPVPSPTSVVINEYNKNELYIGYSNQQIDDFSRSMFHGAEFSYTRNVSRYFGIRGTVSGAYRNNRFNVPALITPGGTFESDVQLNRSVYNFLGGVQIKDNASTSRFKPFGFAMGGVAVNKVKSIITSCTTPSCTTASANIFQSSDTGLAGSFGGGLDIRINDRFDFRLIQVDYNPIYSDSRVDNNFRIGIGIVIK